MHLEAKLKVEVSRILSLDFIQAVSIIFVVVCALSAYYIYAFLAPYCVKSLKTLQPDIFVSSDAVEKRNFLHRVSALRRRRRLSRILPSCYGCNVTHHITYSISTYPDESVQLLREKHAL